MIINTHKILFKQLDPQFISLLKMLIKTQLAKRHESNST